MPIGRGIPGENTTVATSLQDGPRGRGTVGEDTRRRQDRCQPWGSTEVLGVLLTFVLRDSTIGQLSAMDVYWHGKWELPGGTTMRLSEDKIKEGILHPDQAVRDAAVRHFSRSFTRDASLLPLAIRAVQRHGWDAAFIEPYAMFGLPPDEAMLPWVLRRYQRRKSREPVPAKAPRWATLNWLLSHADAQLLAHHKRAIESLGVLASDVRSVVLRRIALLRRDAAVCWRELEEFCMDAHDVDNPWREHGFRARLRAGRGDRPREAKICQTGPLHPGGEVGRRRRWSEILDADAYGENSGRDAVGGGGPAPRRQVGGNRRWRLVGG